MTKKLALAVVLFGMALLTLTGCFMKSSRRFIEGKASELSQVYPTENLEDLFEKFPGGFSIWSEDLYDYKEEGYLFQSVKLNGDIEARKIIGTILWEKVTFDNDDKRHTEVLYEGGVVYKDGMIQLMDPQANATIRNPKLLLQEFTINRNTLSKLKLGRKSYSFETGSADIDYTLSDPILNTYMGVEQDKELKMIIYIMHETVENKAYSYTLDIKDGHNYHTELIEGY
ncbi:hypothetical protein [Streptococcus infantis]|uniref:hypothetical protein n=1 Tax=Streptococcus infantis TaxID=68892 RepID=UPI0039C14395